MAAIAIDVACFRMNFGDPRSDVHPGFTLLHTIFLRNHNRIAATLAKLRPEMTDEVLFQESRKLNIALIQRIIYSQFINALLGDKNDVQVLRLALVSVLSNLHLSNSYF